MSDDRELWIMKRLEWLRITARSAPVLSLIATTISMGLALLALTWSDTRGVGTNLVAFSVVILALTTAAISFLVVTVRRRCLLEKLQTVEREAMVWCVS